MIPLALLIAVLVSFLATLVLVPFVRNVAVLRGWVDRPDWKRKLHAEPIPNIGGVTIALGFGAGLAGLAAWMGTVPAVFSGSQGVLLLGALVMVCAGLYDDVHGLSFKQKFLVQIIVAYGVMHAGYRLDVAELFGVQGDAYRHALFTMPLTMLWIVGVINAVNLLDGLDGLATGVSMVAFGCLALIFGMQGGSVGVIALGLLMVGALAAFLVYNFNPASIFMGDAGSLFIGYMLAVYSLEGTAHVDPLLALIVPAVVLGLPILDTTLAFVRRLRAGHSPFAPDHDHIHHRLARLGSRRLAVLILYGVAVWFGVTAILMTRLTLPYALVVVACTFLVAVLGVHRLGYLGTPEEVEDASFAFDLDPATLVSNGDGVARGVSHDEPLLRTLERDGERDPFHRDAPERAEVMGNDV